MTHEVNRRDFLKAVSVMTAGSYIANGLRTHLLAAQEQPAAQHGPNDQIHLALVGAGGRGMDDTGSTIDNWRQLSRYGSRYSFTGFVFGADVAGRRLADDGRACADVSNGAGCDLSAHHAS